MILILLFAHLFFSCFCKPIRSMSLNVSSAKILLLSSCLLPIAVFFSFSLLEKLTGNTRKRQHEKFVLCQIKSSKFLNKGIIWIIEKNTTGTVIDSISSITSTINISTIHQNWHHWHQHQSDWWWSDKRQPKSKKSSVVTVSAAAAATTAAAQQ